MDQPVETPGGPSSAAAPTPGREITADRVAIIVLNWNRRAETLACVESLGKAKLDGAQVIVVDNGSHDGSVAALQEGFPWVKIVALAENNGFAGGNNAGIRAALADGAEAIVLLNNDTIVAEDFLAPLVWTANSDPKVAGVAGVVLRMDRPELLDAAFLSFYWGHGIVWHYGVNALPGEGFDYPREVDAGIGCSLLMTGEALRTIGPLDEAYFAYHEEVDWCFRAREAGFKIFYQPLSRIWHHGSKSTDTSRPPKPQLSMHRAAQLPNPVPLSWSPVRCYLGARNGVRFIRAHATPEQTRFFIRSTLFSVPLEFLAAVMGREEEWEIGAWGFKRAFIFYFLERRGYAPPPPTELVATLKAHPFWLRSLPIDLLWFLPRDIWRAYRQGCLAQVIETARGLWDGIWNRPLPLKRLGLRQ